MRIYVLTLLVVIAGLHGSCEASEESVAPASSNHEASSSAGSLAAPSRTKRGSYGDMYRLTRGLQMLRLGKRGDPLYAVDDVTNSRVDDVTDLGVDDRFLESDESNEYPDPRDRYAFETLSGDDVIGDVNDVDDVNDALTSLANAYAASSKLRVRRSTPSDDDAMVTPAPPLLQDISGDPGDDVMSGSSLEPEGGEVPVHSGWYGVGGGDEAGDDSGDDDTGEDDGDEYYGRGVWIKPQEYGMEEGQNDDLDIDFGHTDEEKRNLNMLRLGKRNLHMLRLGKRNLHMLRLGKREEEEKRNLNMLRLGKRNLNMLRLGKRNLNMLRLGKREEEEKRNLNMLRLGKRNLHMLRLGKRQLPMIRLGKKDGGDGEDEKRNLNMLRLGKRNLNMLRLGKRNLNMLRLGKRNLNMLRLGKRNLHMLRLGKRQLPMLRLGKKDGGDSEDEKRNLNMLRLGKRNLNMLRLGKRNLHMLRLGKRQLPMIRLGKKDGGDDGEQKRNLNMLRLGKRELKMLRLGKRSYYGGTDKRMHNLQMLRLGKRQEDGQRAGDDGDDDATWRVDWGRQADGAGKRGLHMLRLGKRFVNDGNDAEGEEKQQADRKEE